MQKINVALIGAGRMGYFHAETIIGLPGVRLVVVCDTNLEAARAVAMLTEGVRVTGDPETALSGEIDATVIVTPAISHPNLIKEAAKAGKAIFCEKPLGLSLEAARSARETILASGVPFQIGFQRRYDAGVMRLRNLVSEGVLGIPEIFRSVTADPQGPSFEMARGPGGIFHDTLSHDIDMAIYFMGEIDELYTCGSVMSDPRFHEIGKPETTVISLRFASGALGVIENRMRTGYGYETVLEVAGSQGKGIVRDDRADNLTLMSSKGIQQTHVYWFLERYRNAYRLELAAFFEAVRKNRAPQPGIEEGLQVLEACLTAEYSYKESRPVSLEEVRKRSNSLQ